MDSQTPRPRPLPNVKFRVLVAGRANAGKTTILQRVCETTESPEVYRVTVDNKGKKIREKIQLDPTVERGQHDISHELVFSNHTGYVFHDTRGFESGGTNEIQIVKDFICDCSTRRSLSERLHAIWYCIPMDNRRPELDIIPYRHLSLPGNVPVIAVFTKYEVFRRNVYHTLQDKYQREISSEETDRECQRTFQTKYLDVFGRAAYPAPIYVCLEGMNKPDARCQSLVQTTADALNPDIVALMLLAMRGDNIRLNVHVALERCGVKAAPGKYSPTKQEFEDEGEFYPKSAGPVAKRGTSGVANDVFTGWSWNGIMRKAASGFPVLWASTLKSYSYSADGWIH